MSLLRIASAGATVAAAASLAGWFSPSVWLLLGAILSDLYRAGAGAKDAAAGWLVLVLAAGCIAFGTSSVVPVMLSLTGFVCLMRFGEGAGRTAGSGLVILGVWLIWGIVVSPAAMESWLAAEAWTVGAFVDQPTSGAIIGAGPGTMVLLTGCSGLPMSLDIAIGTFAAGRLFDVAAKQAALIAGLCAAALFTLNLARLCAMAVIAGAYDVLHTDTFNHITGAAVMAGGAGFMIAGRLRR